MQSGLLVRGKGSGIDIAIEAEEVVKPWKQLNEIFAEITGQPLKNTQKDTQPSFGLPLKEAKVCNLMGGFRWKSIENYVPLWFF